IECLENGQWSGPYACKGKSSCVAPPAIENGDIWSSTFLRYSWDHGSTIEYRCHHNYILFGQSHKTCNNGNWIGEIRCSIPVGCGMPPPLEFGDVQSSVKNNYDHGERVEYICPSYYTLDGQTHKTCSNGVWTGEMRCIRKLPSSLNISYNHDYYYYYII
uniref:Sushi domain-containing protein n=1 Tax=Myripristis murdjan TaxID=586833 RepID=A0A668A2P9_9TELE